MRFSSLLNREQLDKQVPDSDGGLATHVVKRLSGSTFKNLQANNGNIGANTARQLNMHRRTLQRKLQKRPVRSQLLYIRRMEIGGPTRTRTWDRRIMIPSQTINHNSPQQPALHFYYNTCLYQLPAIVISCGVLCRSGPNLVQTAPPHEITTDLAAPTLGGTPYPDWFHMACEHIILLDHMEIIKTTIKSYPFVTGLLLRIFDRKHDGPHSKRQISMSDKTAPDLTSLMLTPKIDVSTAKEF